MKILPVGYTTADVMYQWTAGRGVNIASDMKLSQVSFSICLLFVFRFQEVNTNFVSNSQLTQKNHDLN